MKLCDRPSVMFWSALAILTMTTGALAQPGNDSVAGAAGLSSGAPIRGTLLGATPSSSDLDSPWCSAPEPDVWYRLTAVRTGVHTIQVRSVSDPAISQFWGNKATLRAFDTALVPVTGPSVEWQDVDGSGSGSCRIAPYLEAGRTYLVRVGAGALPRPVDPCVGWGGGIFGDVAGDFDIQLTQPAPPPANDDCAGAMLLTLPADVSQDLSGAGPDDYAPCLANTEPPQFQTQGGAWYVYTPAVDQRVVFTVSGAPRANNVIFITSGTCDDLRYERCTISMDNQYNRVVDDCRGVISLAGLGPSYAKFIMPLRAGTAYRIMIGSLDARFPERPENPVRLQMSVVPPLTHDVCANARAITQMPYVDSFELAMATDDQPSSCTEDMFATRQGVWYQYTPASDGQLVVQPDVDEIFALFTGDCSSGLQQINCAEYGAGFASGMGWPVRAGVSYRILVGNSVARRIVLSFDGRRYTRAVVDPLRTVRLDFVSALGACCAPGACTLVASQSACLSTGGDWRGAGSACSRPQTTDAQESRIVEPYFDANGIHVSTVERSITIAQSTTINDVQVLVDLVHPEVGNLRVTLRGPGGQSVDLIARPGVGACQSDYQLPGIGYRIDGEVIFDDGAASAFVDAVNAAYLGTSPDIVTGTHYRPSTCAQVGSDGALIDMPSSLNAVFRGLQAQGTWTLSVADFGVNANLQPARRSTQTLRSFGVIVNGGIASACASAGQAGACCRGATCALVAASACTGTGVSFAGAGSVCGTPTSSAPCCRANFNQVAGVTVQDVFDFIAAWFVGDERADANDSGTLTVQDVFDFLTAWFMGC